MYVTYNDDSERSVGRRHLQVFLVFVDVVQLQDVGMLDEFQDGYLPLHLHTNTEKETSYFRSQRGFAQWEDDRLTPTLPGLLEFLLIRSNHVMLSICVKSVGSLFRCRQTGSGIAAAVLGKTGGLSVFEHLEKRHIKSRHYYYYDYYFAPTRHLFSHLFSLDDRCLLPDWLSSASTCPSLIPQAHIMWLFTRGNRSARPED